MPRHAKPGCAKHHVAALERLVNFFFATVAYYPHLLKWARR
jgi:hypothetical protein